jgi:hypothetical protein
MSESVPLYPFDFDQLVRIHEWNAGASDAELAKITYEYLSSPMRLAQVEQIEKRCRLRLATVDGKAV